MNVGSPSVEYVEVECKSLLHGYRADLSPFRWDINPYRGCRHSCVYCFARYTHEYLGMEDPMDFERKILVKVNAPDVLDRELSSPRWCRNIVNLGGVVDAYQPIEARYGITRGILKVLLKHRNPVAISTKSDLVLRDLDILGELAKGAGAAVALTITTLNEDLQRKLEPLAPPPSRRLDALRRAKEAGVLTGLHLMPILPHITDGEGDLDALIGAAADCGVDYVVADILNLRPSAGKRFWPFLGEEFPELVGRYRRLYKEWWVDPGYSDSIHKRVAQLKVKRGIRDRFLIPRPSSGGEQLALNL
ncbi:MAG: radical SAM protein [bacterium]